MDDIPPGLGMQVLDRGVAWMLSIVLLVLCPVFLQIQRQEAVCQMAVAELTQTCVDQWKRNGGITQEEYDALLEELALWGGYEVEIEYRKRVLEPVWQEGEIVDVITAYLYVPWEDIRTELYEGSGRYDFYQEDLLAVEVHRTMDTIGERIRESIFGIAPDWWIRYGGMVVDEGK